MSYIREAALDETNYPLFADIKSQFGFVPNFYRAQTTRPDLIEAQAQLVNAVLIKESALTRKQKETRRGRAELRLMERAALWSGKPEKRYLPSLMEWMQIRLFTRSRVWTPPQSMNIWPRRWKTGYW